MTILVSALGTAMVIHGYQVDGWAWISIGLVVLLGTPIRVKKGRT